MEPLPYDWPDDAQPFGEFGWEMHISLADTKRYAREHGCPERLLGRVADGWYRARSHAMHTEP